MTKRTKALVIGAVAALAVATVAVVVFGQTATTAPSPREGFLAKVAANLGVSVDDLVAAFSKARMELIDEAVAAGRITAEQAQAMKKRIEARQALRDVMEEAIASGKITPEQLQYLRERRMPDRAGKPWGGGLRGRLMGRMLHEQKCPKP